MKTNKGVVFKPDPFEQFQDWFTLARAKELNDAEAMSLATVSTNGTPNVRMVLCKSFVRDGLQFFTNFESAKGEELVANPTAAVCFHWKSLRRQVRAQGAVSKLPDADNDAYFKQRHRESQYAAWASAQSRPLANQMKLITDAHAIHDKFIGQPVPRPPYWGGYLMTPTVIEFWAEQPHRMHERMLYTRGDDDAWQQQRLYP